MARNQSLLLKTFYCESSLTHFSTIFVFCFMILQIILHLGIYFSIPDPTSQIPEKHLTSKSRVMSFCIASGYTNSSVITIYKL